MKFLDVNVFVYMYLSSLRTWVSLNFKILFGVVVV